MSTITKNVSAAVLTVAACNAENVLLTINGDGRQPELPIRDDIDRMGYYAGLLKALHAKRARLEKDPQTPTEDFEPVDTMIADVADYIRSLTSNPENIDQYLRFTAWYSVYGTIKRDNGKLDRYESNCNIAKYQLAPVLRLILEHYDGKEASKNEVSRVINSVLELPDSNKVPRKVCARVLSSIYAGLEVDKKSLKVKEKFNDLNAVKVFSLLYLSEILPALEDTAK